MIIFACIFIAAIGLAFGFRGLRALAGVFLVGCAAFTIWIGVLFAQQQANADQINRELAESDRKAQEWWDQTALPRIRGRR